MSIHAANLKLRDKIRGLEQTITLMRALHSPCSCCAPKQCKQCLVNYPCPTIKALDGEQE
jgi:hypothetical protein